MLPQSEIDWPGIIEQVARELLGDPNRTYSGKRELRYGRKGSLSIRLERGTWHDFERGEGGGVLALIQDVTGCDEAAAWDWLRQRGHAPETGKAPDSRGTRSHGHSPERRTGRSTRSKSPQQQADSPKSPDLPAISAGWEQIPQDADHPVRRYAALRGLWEIQSAWPAGMAWLPAAAPWFRGKHTGAGALLMKLAPLESWQRGGPVAPRGLQLVSITSKGTPALDRPESDGGLPKRTYGPVRGACLLLGTGTDVLHICEGLADGLRILRYCGGAVACAFGTSGLASSHTWDGIDRYRTIVLWPDADAGGMAARRSAMNALSRKGIETYTTRLPLAADPADVPPDVLRECYERARKVEKVEPTTSTSPGRKSQQAGDDSDGLDAAIDDLMASWSKF